jgi:hypothetical protein
MGGGGLKKSIFFKFLYDEDLLPTKDPRISSHYPLAKQNLEELDETLYPKTTPGTFDLFLGE